MKVSMRVLLAIMFLLSSQMQAAQPGRQVFNDPTGKLDDIFFQVADILEKYYATKNTWNDWYGGQVEKDYYKIGELRDQANDINPQAGKALDAFLQQYNDLSNDKEARPSVIDAIRLSIIKEKRASSPSAASAPERKREQAAESTQRDILKGIDDRFKKASIEKNIEGMESALHEYLEIAADLTAISSTEKNAIETSMIHEINTIKSAARPSIVIRTSESKKPPVVQPATPKSQPSPSERPRAGTQAGQQMPRVTAGQGALRPRAVTAVQVSENPADIAREKKVVDDLWQSFCGTLANKGANASEARRSRAAAAESVIDSLKTLTSEQKKKLIAKFKDAAESEVKAAFAVRECRGINKISSEAWGK